MRGHLPKRGWQLGASANYGNGLGSEDARWWWFDGSTSHAWHGPRVSFALATTGFALRYSRPFEYDAYAVDLTPALTVNLSRVQVTAAPRGTAGFWSGDGVDGDIGMFGGQLQLASTFGLVSGSLTAEVYEARNGALDGTYRGAGLEATVSASRSLQLGGSVKRWRNPFESEWGYSAFAAKAISSDVHIDLRIARSVTDAVLAAPGSAGASLGVSWRVLSGARGLPRPVAQVMAPRSSGRLVVFTVEADAESLAVSGSFSDWTPIPMRRSGDKFTVEVVVQPGTYQYGFLVNGTEWYVPENALGIVDDGFGRKNATLVVERR